MGVQHPWPDMPRQLLLSAGASSSFQCHHEVEKDQRYRKSLYTALHAQLVVRMIIFAIQAGNWRQRQMTITA